MITAIYAVDQLLLRWQSGTVPWQQLLQQAFGRSAPVDLNGIAIELLDGTTMAGLRGAYTASDPSGAERIYLNAAWLTTATAPELEAVLLEELGHAIDHRLNGDRDTPGDEGAIFSALIRGVSIPAVETTQNDQHTLIINGQSIAVEAAAPVASGSPSLTAVAEDSTDPAGDTVANLFTSSFSDSDDDTLKAVAITANSAKASTEGSWQYSTDSGTTWISIATSGLSDSSALYLTSSTLLRFIPVSDFNGTPGDLTAHLIDSSYDTTPTFFTSSSNPFSLGDIGSYASSDFADLDADGDLDAFIGNNDGNTIYFENTGTSLAPAFAASASNPFSIVDVGYNAVQDFADLDGDGDLDAFIGNFLGDTIYFENTGTSLAPAFAASSSNPFSIVNTGYMSSPVFADLDGDGDLDAFTSNYNGNTIYFENTGTSLAPAFAASSSNPFSIVDVGANAALNFADLDADGDLDAFIGNNDGNTIYFENTGTSLAPAFAASASNPFSIVDVGQDAAPDFADLDGDGDLDAFIGNNDGNTIYFENTGTSSAGSSIDVSTNGGSTAFSSESLTLSTSITADYIPAPTPTPEPPPATTGPTPTQEPFFPVELPADLADLNADDVATLTPDLVSELSSDQLSDLPPAAVQGFSSDQIAQLSTDAVAAFTAQKITQLTAEAVSGLSEAQVSELPAKAVKGFNADQVSKLPTKAVKGFNADQVSKLPAKAVKGFNADQVSKLPTKAVKGFNADQVSKLPTKAVKGFNADQLSKLPTKAVKGFNADQVEQLPKRSFKALESVQLAKLSKDAVTGLTSTQLKTISGDEIAAFKPSTIKAISPDSISGLKPAALDDLSKRQVKTLSDEQLAGLSNKQIRKADDFIDALSVQQRDALFLDPARSNRLTDPLDPLNALKLTTGQDPLA